MTHARDFALKGGKAIGGAQRRSGIVADNAGHEAYSVFRLESLTGKPHLRQVVIKPAVNIKLLKESFLLLAGLIEHDFESGQQAQWNGFDVYFVEN